MRIFRVFLKWNMGRSSGRRVSPLGRLGGAGEVYTPSLTGELEGSWVGVGLLFSLFTFVFINKMLRQSHDADVHGASVVAEHCRMDFYLCAIGLECRVNVVASCGLVPRRQEYAFLGVAVDEPEFAGKVVSSFLILHYILHSSFFILRSLFFILLSFLLD